jgi:hypothetical protein
MEGKLSEIDKGKVIKALKGGINLASLEFKVGDTQLKDIKVSKLSDPRSSDSKVKAIVDELLTKSDDISKKASKYLHAGPDTPHHKPDIDSIVIQYDQLGVVIEPAEILKSWLENSVKIYKKHLENDESSDQMPNVDIRLIELEADILYHQWELKVNNLLKREESGKKWKITDIIDLSKPSKNIQADKELLGKVEEVIDELREWYKETQKEHTDDFDKVLSDYWVHFDDDSFVKVKIEESKDTRKRKAEQPSDDNLDKKKAKTSETNIKK